MAGLVEEIARNRGRVVAALAPYFYRRGDPVVAGTGGGSQETVTYVPEAHGIAGDKHSVIGQAWGLVGIVATDTLGLLTARSSPGRQASVVRTDANGLVTLEGLGVNATPAVGKFTLSGTIEFVDSGIIATTDAGDLSLSPAGGLVLDPTSKAVIPATANDINLGSIRRKFGAIYASEMYIDTLVAADGLATIGGRILVGPTTFLTSDLFTQVGDTTIYVEHNNLAINDNLILEARGSIEHLLVTAGPVGAGPYSYTVTRDRDASGRNYWWTGDAVFSTGTTGDGFIDLYSLGGVKTSDEEGPSIIGNVRNSATWNDWGPRWAIGNLHGLYGYAADEYGAAFGKYAATEPNLTIDVTNGIRFRVHNTDHLVIDADGIAFIGTTGGGAVNFNSDGIQIDMGTGAPNKIEWMDGATTGVQLYGYEDGNFYYGRFRVDRGTIHSQLYISAETGAGGVAYLGAEDAANNLTEVAALGWAKRVHLYAPAGGEIYCSVNGLKLHINAVAPEIMVWGTIGFSGNSTCQLRRNGSHIEWHDGVGWVQLDNGP